MHPFIAAKYLKTIQAEEVVELKECICNTIRYLHSEAPWIPREIRLQAFEDSDDEQRMEVWINNATSNQVIGKVWIFSDGRILRDVLYYFTGPFKTIEDYKDDPRYTFSVHGLEISLYDILLQDRRCSWCAVDEEHGGDINDSTLLWIEWGNVPKGITTLRKENIKMSYSPYTTSEVVEEMIATLPEQVQKEYAWEYGNAFNIGIIDIDFIPDDELDDECVTPGQFYGIDLFECDAYDLGLCPSFDPRKGKGVFVVNERLVDCLVTYARSLPS